MKLECCPEINKVGVRVAGSGFGVRGSVFGVRGSGFGVRDRSLSVGSGNEGRKGGKGVQDADRNGKQGARVEVKVSWLFDFDGAASVPSEPARRV
jgi:hypothetical protein